MRFSRFPTLWKPTGGESKKKTERKKNICVSLSFHFPCWLRPSDIKLSAPALSPSPNQFPPYWSSSAGLTIQPSLKYTVRTSAPAGGHSVSETEPEVSYLACYASLTWNVLTTCQGWCRRQKKKKWKRHISKLLRLYLKWGTGRLHFEIFF